MIIIFGTRGLKTKVSSEPPLTNQCPNCSGTLYLKNYKRWFTLFFIPIFPINTVDTFYECGNCKSAYSEKIRDILNQNTDEKDKAIEEGKRLFAKALAASMTHMAMIDGDYAKEEEREIIDTINNFPQYKDELVSIVENVKEKGNENNYVFDLLSKVRYALSSEALLNLLAQSAIVLLADGKIEKEEETLMKEYLIACGLPKEFYKTLLDKLKKVEIANN